MEKQKWSSILISLIYIALGLLFIVQPKGVESMLCYVLAIAIAVMGLLHLAGFFIMSSADRSEHPGNGFVIGLLMIALAVFVVAKQDLVIALVPFLFGVMVMIRGLLTIQTGFHLRRLGADIRPPLIMGAVIMAAGLFVMLFPIQMGETLLIIIGFCLMAGGVSGLVEEIMIRHGRRAAEYRKERARDMADYDPKAHSGAGDDEAAGGSAGEVRAIETKADSAGTGEDPVPSDAKARKPIKVEILDEDPKPYRDAEGDKAEADR